MFKFWQFCLFPFAGGGGVYAPTDKLIRVFVHQFSCQTKFSCIDRAIFRKYQFSNYPMAQVNGLSDSKAFKTI